MFCLVSATMGSQNPLAQVNGGVTTENGGLHYKVMGRGTAILLLSGGPGFSSEYLLPVANTLGKSYQCILFDQRGTGGSKNATIDSTTINLRTAVEDIETLRKRLEAGRLILFGHSWGGVLAMSYAAAYPARVQAMVLVGSGGPFDYPDQSVGARIRARLLPSDLEAMAYWRDASRVAADPKLAANQQFRAALRAYVFDRANLPNITYYLTLDSFEPKIYQLMSEDLLKINYDVRPALTGLKQPVLIVQGRQDIVGEATARRIQQAVPNSKLEFIENSGHFPWAEQSEKFFAVITRFLHDLRSSDG